MPKKKFKLIVIAPPNDYKREIICDDMDWSNGAYYFYNKLEDNRRWVLCYYPIVNTVIESIEDLTEIEEDEKSKEDGKIINEVKGIN
jgi:hypothetical protein